MRPQRFEDFALTAVRDSRNPLVGGVLPIAESGETERGQKGQITHRNGIAVKLASGGVLRWQIMANNAEDFSQAEVPVEGEKPMTPIDGGQLTASPDGAAAEAWLAGVLSGAGSRELADIECWSRRKDARPGHHGLTVVCHSGARLYVRAF